MTRDPTAPPCKPGRYSEGMLCDPMVVIVYSSIMIGICPELPGSGRSRWTTNHLVTQQKIRNNRTYPDVCVANPLVPGSGPPAPHQRHKRGCTARVWNGRAR